jgi:hypothetical protein
VYFFYLYITQYNINNGVIFNPIIIKVDTDLIIYPEDTAEVIFKDGERFIGKFKGTQRKGVFVFEIESNSLILVRSTLVDNIVIKGAN